LNEKEFKKGQMICSYDDIMHPFKITEGRVSLTFQSSSLPPLQFEKGAVLGIAQHWTDRLKPVLVVAEEDTELLQFSPEELEEVVSPLSPFLLAENLAQLLAKLCSAKSGGLPTASEKGMYLAFSSYARQGDKTHAVDCYGRFLNAYLESEFIDSMLEVIQKFTFGETSETSLDWETGENAFEMLEKRLGSSDPQQNILILRNFEESHPDSPRLDEVYQKIVEEYDKLGDEYQLNHYLRKLLYRFPTSRLSEEALFQLVLLERRNGEPAWYEDALRFLYIFPHSPHCEIFHNLFESKG